MITRLNLSRIDFHNAPSWALPLMRDAAAREQAEIDDARTLLARERADLRARLAREGPRQDRTVAAARLKVADAREALQAAEQAHREACDARYRVIGTAEHRIEQIDHALAHSADPAIGEAKEALRDEWERARQTRVETHHEPTGREDRHGNPVLRVLTTLPALERRLRAFRLALEALDRLKLAVGVDVPAAVAAIRAAIPPVPTAADAVEAGTVVATPLPEVLEPRRVGSLFGPGGADLLPSAAMDAAADRELGATASLGARAIKAVRDARGAA